MNKIIVYTYINVFIIIVILIIICLIGYYFSPNNYIKKDFNEEKFILNNKESISIEPNSFYEFDTTFYLRFVNEQKIIINNFIKSQSIILEKNNIIKTPYNILIFNNDDCTKTIEFELYNKI
jgi:hypothetical protein